MEKRLHPAKKRFEHYNTQALTDCFEVVHTYRMAQKFSDKLLTYCLILIRYDKLF